jgi:hypothetical protein
LKTRGLGQMNCCYQESTDPYSLTDIQLLALPIRWRKAEEFPLKLSNDKSEKNNNSTISNLTSLE